jgi:phage tail-like protein
MPDELAQAAENWPAPKFFFQVRFGSDSDVVLFQEVSGLDVEHDPIEYRGGNSPAFSASRMPGIKSYGNVTMKKGVFASDNRFWDWYKRIKLNTSERMPVTISLLDEVGNPTMVWTLTNAWPTKVTGTDLNAEGNEVSVESIEIAHEGLTVANA